MTNKTRTPLFPLLPASLLMALALSAAPAQAEPIGTLHVEVVFNAHGSPQVIAPSDWTCNLTTEAGLVPVPLSVSYTVDCSYNGVGDSVGLFAWCDGSALLFAGVQQQSGDLGHTTAAAICDTGRAQCDGFVVLNAAEDCLVGILGDGLAKCAFVTTVNVNYQRVGVCDIPIVAL